MSDQRSNSSVGSKIGAFLFLLLFLAGGVFFLGLIGRDVQSVAAEFRWTPTPCTILRSVFDPRGSNYHFDVRYRYTFQGRVYTSTVFQTADAGSEDATAIERLMLRYPAGAQATCRVNPADPAEAILATQPLWSAAFVFIPLIFIVVGAGGIWFVWRPPNRSASPSKSKTNAVPWIIGVPFTLAGLGILFGLTVPHVWQYWSARSWPAVPCVVEASRVRKYQGNKGSTYSIDILYRYRVKGKTYQSNRYDMSAGSSGGYADKRQVVWRYPPGKRAVCFVDPSDPLSAVLSRDFPEMYLFLTPFAMVFAGIGIALLMWGGGSGATARAPTVTGLPGHFGGQPIRTGPGPAARLLAIVAVCCFWNGIVSLFLHQMIDGWRHGSGDIFLTIFLVPFELVGLGLLIGAGYVFLGLFNPRPKIVLANTSISPGQSTWADWSFSRSPGRVRDLTIELIGQESAMVVQRSGNGESSKQIRTEVFFRQSLIDATDSRQIATGRTQLTIPANTMHSLAARSNKVSWLLRVKGTIPHWPAIKQDFAVNVVPTPTAGRPTPVLPATDAIQPTAATGPLRIQLPAGRTNFAPGEAIDVALAWDLDTPATSIDARFFWYTTGRGDSASATVETQHFDSPAQRDHFLRRLHLPAGPWSFAGKLISLGWAIELGAKSISQTERVEMTIAPAGQAIRLADGIEAVVM